MVGFIIKLNISLFLWILFVEFSQSVDKNENHLICLEKGTKCEDMIGTLITKDYQKEIVNAVNDIRSDVARGELSYQHFENIDKLSKGIGEMRWDDKLAEIAQAKANQCDFKRSDRSKMTIGEFETGEIIGQGNINWIKEDKYWFQRIAKIELQATKFDVELLNKARNSDVQGTFGTKKYIGDFVELLKDEIYLIGCGASEVTSGNTRKILHVCHLGPQRKGSPAPLWSYDDCKQNFGPESSLQTGKLCNTDHQPNAKELLNLGEKSLKAVVCSTNEGPPTPSPTTPSPTTPSPTGDSRGAGSFFTSHRNVQGIGFIFNIAMLYFFK